MLAPATAALLTQVDLLAARAAALARHLPCRTAIPQVCLILAGLDVPAQVRGRFGLCVGVGLGVGVGEGGQLMLLSEPRFMPKAAVMTHSRDDALAHDLGGRWTMQHAGAFITECRSCAPDPPTSAVLPCTLAPSPVATASPPPSHPQPTGHSLRDAPHLGPLARLLLPVEVPPLHHPARRHAPGMRLGLPLPPLLLVPAQPPSLLAPLLLLHLPPL